MPCEERRSFLGAPLELLFYRRSVARGHWNLLHAGQQEGERGVPLGGEQSHRCVEALPGRDWFDLAGLKAEAVAPWRVRGPEEHQIGWRRPFAETKCRVLSREASCVLGPARCSLPSLAALHHAQVPALPRPCCPLPLLPSRLDLPLPLAGTCSFVERMLPLSAAGTTCAGVLYEYPPPLRPRLPTREESEC